MTYISSQSLSAPIRQSVLQAQSQLAQVQTEVSTGTYADIGLTLGASTGSSLSLKSEIDNLNTLVGTNSFATTRLSAAATALNSLVSNAQNISQALVTASTPGGLTTSVQSAASGALQVFVSAMNSSAGGQFVFSGDKTDTAPIANYSSSPTSAGKAAVDAAFQSAFGTSQTSSGASAVTGSQMSSFLNTQFDALFADPNWSSWSSASNSTMQTTIAPSQTTSTSLSANQSAFRQLAEAYTMVSEFTGSNMSADARAAVVSKASGLVGTALASLTSIQAGVGTAQAAVSSANDTMNAQITTLTAHVSDLESVDTYALSSQVTQLQNQLEASYSLTSRLQQLSLTNYLTSG